MKTAKIPATGQEFPIGKIVCLARNYAEHARELGNETPAAPVLFMKPATSVIGDGDTVRIPAYSQECHYEVELAVLIGTTVPRNVSDEDAMECLAGYGVGHRHDPAGRAERAQGQGAPLGDRQGIRQRPARCPISSRPASIADPHNLNLKLSVNGEMRQDGCSSDMINRIPQIIAHISSIFTLEPGDVILTGTPAGRRPGGGG